MAPELLRQGKFGRAADIYSFAIISAPLAPEACVRRRYMMAWCCIISQLTLPCCHRTSTLCGLRPAVWPALLLMGWQVARCGMINH